MPGGRAQDSAANSRIKAQTSSGKMPGGVIKIGRPRGTHGRITRRQIIRWQFRIKLAHKVFPIFLVCLDFLGEIPSWL